MEKHRIITNTEELSTDLPAVLTEPEESEYELVHLNLIRAKLKKAKNDFQEKHHRKLSRTTLFRYLKREGISISESTVEDLYNPDSKRTRINLSAVLKLCELFGADASAVLALPGEASIPTSNNAKKTDETRKLFYDPMYSGIYHVFFMRYSGRDTSYNMPYPHSLKKTEDLVHGTLEFIFSEDHNSKCHFKYSTEYTTADNTREIKNVSATCIPYESIAGSNVFLEFVDQQGAYYEIVFQHQTFLTAHCIFRTAVFIAENTNVGHYPVLQKMVMFYNEPPEANYEYIRGLLNFAAKDIVIEIEELNRMKKTDSEIGLFLDNYGKILSNEPYLKNNVLVINEDMVLNTQSEISNAELMRALVKLRHHSYMQNQLLVGADPHAYELVRDLETDT